MDPIKEEYSTPKEKVTAKRYFTEEELNVMVRENTDKLIELDTIEEEIEALKKKHAATQKKLKVESKSLRKLVRAGFVEELRECYLTPNFQSGNMEYTCVQTGELLLERRLRPEEKQLRLQHPKAG